MHWRLQDLLSRHGPRVLLVSSLVLVVWLAGLSRVSGVPGYAEVSPVRVASLETARVAAVLVAAGDLVQGGEVLAELDPATVDGEIRVLEAELARFAAQLQDVEHDARAAQMSADAAVADSASRLSGAKETLAVREAWVQRAEQQVAAGLASADGLPEARAELVELRGEVRRLQGELSHREEALRVAKQRASGSGGAEAPALQQSSRARAVVEAELAAARDRRAGLTLRAPISARVSAVHHRVGEVLPAEQPLLELLPLSTSTVVACLPEQYGIGVRAGSRASLNSWSGGHTWSGVVLDVVGLVAEAPDRCKQRVNDLGWVRPVRIQAETGALVPGERFEVVFLPDGGA